MPSSASQEFERGQHPLPHQRRVQHAAVEQHVRRDRPARSGRAAPRPAPNSAACCRRKRAMWRVMAVSAAYGKPEFLQTHAALRAPASPCSRPPAGSPRPAPVRYRSRSSAALMVPPTRPVPLPRIVTDCSAAVEPGSSSFSFATRQLFHSDCSWRLSMLRALLRQPLPTPRPPAPDRYCRRPAECARPPPRGPAPARPSTSVTAMSVKSVVPPPISTTRMRSPGCTRSRQSAWRSIQA